MKKVIAAVLFALALTASAPVASAEIDMPVCYPCRTRSSAVLRDDLPQRFRSTHSRSTDSLTGKVWLR